MKRFSFTGILSTYSFTSSMCVYMSFRSSSINLLNSSDSISSFRAASTTGKRFKSPTKILLYFSVVSIPIAERSSIV